MNLKNFNSDLPMMSEGGPTENLAHEYAPSFSNLPINNQLLNKINDFLQNHPQRSNQGSAMEGLQPSILNPHSGSGTSL